MKVFNIKNQKTLSSCLYELVDKVTQNLKGRMSKKEMVIVKYPYYRAKISDFKYDKGNKSYATSFEPILKDRWDDRKKFKFLAEVKEFGEFQETAGIISENYKMEKNQADYLLERFVHKIIDQSLSDISEQTSLEIISMFIADLEQTPKNWHPIIWISGINMDAGLVNISKNIHIKKPEPADLEFETPIYSKPTFIRYDLSFRMPDTIIKAKYREKSNRDTQKRIEALISTLRLYKVGSVISTQIELNPDSVFAMGGVLHSHKTSAPMKYELDKNDERKLQDFYNLFEPIVTSLIDKKDKRDLNYVTIAFERYNTALEETRPESRLTYATMCLEALYLGAETEMTRRLSQRVSCALSLLGYKPLEVSSVMKRSYKIRSRFVHGVIIKDKDRKNSGKLEKELLEYSRSSLLMFMQIQDKIKKDNFLTKLDTSLLDGKEKNKLKEFISKNCQIVEINPSYPC